MSNNQVSQQGQQPDSSVLDKVLSTQTPLSHAIIESSNNPIAVVDALQPDLPLIYVNDAFEQVTGYPPEEVVGKNCRFLQGEDNDQPALDELREAIQKQKPCDVILRNYRKDGTFFWNRLRMFPIFDEAGVMTHIVGQQSDITELRMAQEDMAQMLESSPEAIGLVNTETGLFEAVNRAAEVLYGLSREELVKVGPGQMSPEFQANGRSSFEAAGEKIGEALAGEQPIFEWLHQNAKGEIVPCEVRLVGLPGKRSHLVRFSVTDISDRIQRRQHLEKLASELQIIAEIATKISTITDQTALLQTVVEMTKAQFALYYAQIYLLDESGTMLKLAAGSGRAGKKLQARGHQLSLKQAQSIVARAGREKQAIRVNDVHENPAHLPNPLLPETRAEMAIPMLLAGELIGVLDVQSEKVNRFSLDDEQVKTALAAQTAVAVQSARRLTETQKLLQEQEQLAATLANERNVLQIIMDTLPGYVYAKDRQSRFLWANMATAHVMGVDDPKKLLGKTDLDFYPSKLGEKFYHDEQRLFESGQSILNLEERLVDQTTKEETWISTNKVLTRDERGNVSGMVGIGLDITEQKLATRRIERQAQIIRTTPILIGAATMQGETTYINPSGLELLGYAPEEIVDKPIGEFIAPEARERLQNEILPQLLESGTWRGENKFITKDGQLLDVDQALFIVNDDHGVAQLIATSVVDITERREAEAQIREREALMQTIIDALPQWIYVKDRAHRYRLVNHAFVEAMSGVNGRLDAGFFIGKNDLEVGLPEHVVIGDVAQGVRGLWAEETAVIESGELTIQENEPTLFNDEKGYIRTVRVPLKNQNNQVWGILSSVQDITFQVQAQEELARAKEELEQRVAERTAELAQSNEQIQTQFEDSLKQAEILRKRAAELDIVTQVSEAASSSEEADELLVNVMNVIKQSFNLYHAHIYEMNEAKTAVVLTYGSGEAGRKMRQQGRSIALDNERSLVVRAARTREGVIENDLQAAPGYLANPLLPDSRSSLAIPMIVGEAVIGVFNVQSDKVNHFSDEDIRIQTTIANQISLALQNAKAFAQSERALNELNRLAQQLTREGWDGFTAELGGEQTYLYDLHKVQKLDEPKPHDEMHKQTIAVRGTQIGELALKLPDAVDEEAALIIDAVAARLGEHLETLRLTEQTQKALAETATQADRLAELNELAKLYTNAADVQTLYAITAQRLNAMMDVQQANVALLTKDRTELEFYSLSTEMGAITLSTRIPVDGTATGAALREQTMLLAGDIRHSTYLDHEQLAKRGMCSTVAVPLLVQSKPIGCLNVASTSVEAFSENDGNILSQIGALLSAALESQQLLAQTQARAERERRVRAITDKIRKRASREGILQTAREEIGEFLQARETAVQLGDAARLLEQLRQAQNSQTEQTLEAKQGQGD